MGEQLVSTTYWLDGQERIVRVSDNWDAFALANEGRASVASVILKRPLWDFITNDVTRVWMETLLKLARLRSDPVQRPYRCDSPHQRRFMEMRIYHEPGGLLRLEHEFLSIEQTDRPVHIVACDNEREYHSRCSICGRVRHDDEWMEPALLCVREGLVQEDCLRVIYTVCDSCMRLLPRSEAG
jgi:hypothetical protein